jgi:zinc protease
VFHHSSFLRLLAVCALAFWPAALDAKVFDPARFVLPNGLEVVVVEDPRMPAVVHMVWYKVGSADEPRGKSGIAHYLEHMMFKGTRDQSPGAFSRMVAANGGRENAFTNFDFTAYHQTVARDRLELVMKLEADRMANLIVTEDQAAPELQVVLEERRSRIDNEPSAQLDEKVRAALFAGHPYAIPVIGFEDEIRGLTAADARDFYARHYAPNNAILVVAGDVTAAQLRPLVERYYGAVPRREVPDRARAPVPETAGARRVSLESPRVRRASLHRSFLAPSHRTAPPGHAYALEVLSEILGGPTGRLHRALVLDRAVAVGASAYYDSGTRENSRFAFGAVPRDNTSLEVLEAALDAEIAVLLRDGVSRDEVERAQRRLQSAAIYARDSLQTGARAFGAALAVGRSVADVEEWPARIGAVTPEQVNVAARAVLKPERSVTGTLLPKATP